MSKSRTHFICRSCGSVQSRWMGKCPDCGTWDALEKFIEPKPIAEAAHASLAEGWIGAGHEATTSGDDAGGGNAHGGTGVSPVRNALAVPLPSIECTDVSRLPTTITELDRVLGGGLVPGSVVLLGGDPGIGKSTLMLQAAGRLARRDRPVLYVTSEESAYQTRLRAERLFNGGTGHGFATADLTPVPPSLDHLYVLADTNLARIVEQARKVRPGICVIDSIQMIYKSDLPASPGSVTQLRQCCMELVYLAKVSQMAIVLVGHITKDGSLAGPKLLEHLVDAVLTFEGDRHHSYRVVRGIKNRYGTTLEVGLFEMTGTGLEEVDEAARVQAASEQPRPGSVICPAMHGSRALLVEIQALTAAGFLGSAKRKTSGLDANRLAMLIAVLEKHGGLRLADQDVFASAVGGLKVIEPAADLAIALAIAGAHYGRALNPGVAAIGEVGLGGEIRAVQQIEQRAKSAARLGYQTLIAPPGAPAAATSDTGQMIRVRSISEALELLGPAPSPSPQKRKPQMHADRR